MLRHILHPRRRQIRRNVLRPPISLRRHIDKLDFLFSITKNIFITLLNIIFQIKTPKNVVDAIKTPLQI